MASSVNVAFNGKFYKHKRISMDIGNMFNGYYNDLGRSYY